MEVTKEKISPIFKIMKFIFTIVMLLPSLFMLNALAAPEVGGGQICDHDKILAEIKRVQTDLPREYWRLTENNRNIVISNKSDDPIYQLGNQSDGDQDTLKISGSSYLKKIQLKNNQAYNAKKDFIYSLLGKKV